MTDQSRRLGQWLQIGTISADTSCSGVHRRPDQQMTLMSCVSSQTHLQMRITVSRPQINIALHEKYCCIAALSPWQHSTCTLQLQILDCHV